MKPGWKFFQDNKFLALHELQKCSKKHNCPDAVGAMEPEWNQSNLSRVLASLR